MKKIWIGILVLLLLGVTGCEKVSVGNYKKGTYFGHVTDHYGGSLNEAIASVYVGDDGQIKSVYLDTTYIRENGTTTKKSLGNDYHMKTYSDATSEWYEQVQKIEDAVVENQGLDFIKWTDEEKSKTDSISGVTIKIDALYQALQEALKKAKK